MKDASLLGGSGSEMGMDGTGGMKIKMERVRVVAFDAEASVAEK
jgi:hypothetical protein